MGNTFGHLFRVTTFGESHGGGVGAVVDGCPPGMTIDVAEIQKWLDRRRPGQSVLSSPRQEEDRVEILSGLENGKTLGTPIALFCRNKDAKPGHYDDLSKVFRPSHADYTTLAKYGIRASSGGGRASARETIGRVAAAAIAEQVLQQLLKNFAVVGFVETVKDLPLNEINIEKVTRAAVEKSMLRCPDLKASKAMEELIIKAKKKGDSVGGIIRCIVRGCPVGLGAPVFDKLEADLAKAMMSLPATKGFEVGMGFASTKLFGSEHNDAFIMQGKKVRTRTNRSGGIQGGISNGEIIDLRVAFKPVATIFKDQDSVDETGKAVKVKPRQGRHDPCVLPRAVPMVEAMAILVIMDHFLRQRAIAS